MLTVACLIEVATKTGLTVSASRKSLSRHKKSVVFTLSLQTTYSFQPKLQCICHITRKNMEYGYNPCFSAIFTKGNNFYAFLFAFLEKNESFRKRV